MVGKVLAGAQTRHTAYVRALFAELDADARCARSCPDTIVMARRGTRGASA